MPMPLPRHLASLVPYSPGKPIEEVERELGIAHAVKLASNENPLGPSPRAMAVLTQHLGTLHRYPDGGAHGLREAIAKKWGVPSDQVIVGNGSDEIISLLVRAFLAPGEEAIMADHTFVMYKIDVVAGRGVPVEVPLKQWAHDLDAMAGAVTDRTRLVFLCNPNNPTGTIVSRWDLERFLDRLPDHVLVVCDEAYYEYVRAGDYPNALDYVKERRPVVVLRTFSKIYGLAGLRVGYGISTAEVVGYLHRIRPPFNVNALAQRAALAALDDQEHLDKSRTLNETEMVVLEKGLRKLGYGPVPSQANFLYFETNGDGRSLYEALLREGVIVRHIQGPMIRVTVGTPSENARFLEALRKVQFAPSSRGAS